MKIVFTRPALNNLEDIRSYLKAHYPALAGTVESRIQVVLRRIAMYPRSAPVVEQRSGVRVVLVLRFPYKIFYRIASKTLIEILYIHHETSDQL